MKVAVLRRGSFEVDEFPESVPEHGQVLVQVKACGICGSDLHFAQLGAEVLAVRRQMTGAAPPGGTTVIDLTGDIFMGHVFACEVLEAGPETDAPAPGTVVTSIPAV